MKKYPTLPEGYRRLLRIDLAKNKKEFWGVHIAAFAMIALLCASMAAFVPLSTLVSGEPLWVALRFAGIGVGYAVGVVLHEGIHGLFFALFGGQRPKFGLSRSFAFAGSDAYYAKLPYLWITLSPAVVLSLLFGTLSVLSMVQVLPLSLFWVFYFLHAFHFGGAVGDFYVALRLLLLPAQLLVKDDGTGMDVFVKEEA